MTSLGAAGYDLHVRSAPIGFWILPFWHLSAPKRGPRRPLVPRLFYDVVIVGAGFTGLWMAKHLLPPRSSR